MYLAEAEERSLTALAESAEAVPPPGGRWRDFPHSAFSHHGAACCETADTSSSRRPIRTAQPARKS